MCVSPGESPAPAGESPGHGIYAHGLESLLRDSSPPLPSSGDGLIRLCFQECVRAMYPSGKLLHLASCFPGRNRGRKFAGRETTPAIQLIFSDPSLTDPQAEVVNAITGFLATVFMNRSSSPRQSRVGNTGQAPSSRLVLSVVANTDDVLCQAECCFYSGQCILVEWLGVTGSCFAKAKFGPNGDNEPFWNRGLSSFLLAAAQFVGSKLFNIHSHRLFAEVDNSVVAFYQRLSFDKVRRFPEFIASDPSTVLHSAKEPDSYHKMQLSNAIKTRLSFHATP
jgi:hypothetical protein